MCMIDMGKQALIEQISFRQTIVIFRSQYFDKDGDLAHEFYEEKFVDNTPVMIKQESSCLRPQGWIRYKVPRLHYDFPAVIMSH